MGEALIGCRGRRRSCPNRRAIVAPATIMVTVSPFIHPASTEATAYGDGYCFFFGTYCLLPLGVK
jgi:hypothetical protein